MIVLLIILLILAVLLNIKAVLFIKYEDGVFTCFVRYLFVKLNLPFKPRRKKAKAFKSDKKSDSGKNDSKENDKNKPPDEKKSRKKSGSKKKPSLQTENIAAVIDFIRSSADSIFGVVKKIKISDLCADFTVADEDACTCAVNFGIISAGVYNILGFTAAHFKTDIDHVNIGLKYNNNKSVYNFSLKLEMSPGTAVLGAAGVFFSYLKMQLGKTGEKEKSNKNNLSKECTMMENHPVNGLMGTAIEKIRDMIDVNTIIGDPISTPEGATIIPVSKVSFGFASGGSDLPSKQPKNLFGGAAGAGVSVQPLAFICVSPNGDVKLLQMSVNASKENAMISTLPDLIDKISALVNGGEKKPKKGKKNKKTDLIPDDSDVLEEED